MRPDTRLALRDASRSRKILADAEQGDLVLSKLKKLELHNTDYRVNLRDASRSRKLLADAEQGDFTQTITLLRLSPNSQDSNAPNELTMLVFIIS